MAYTRKFNYTRYSISESGDQIALGPETFVGPLPRIFWGNGVEWAEASLYLAARADVIPEGFGSTDALASHAKHLKAYADFIESNDDLEWDKFGARRRQRPTYRFRGYLIKCRDEVGDLAPSTVTNRIRSVKAFYQWILANKILFPEYDVYEPRTAKIRIARWHGINDAITVHSSDLAIPNRTRSRNGVEGGLLPLSLEHRNLALSLARKYCTEEFALALELGFYTGMRIGSIIDIKVETIEMAKPSRDLPGYYELAIGPAHNVQTKGDVNYHPAIPTGILRKLNDYICGVKRSIRKAKAQESGSNANLVFITRRGARYTVTSWQHEMNKLRALALARGVDLSEFYFHCTRATFGTLLVAAMLSQPTAKTVNILATIKRLMGHAHERTTLEYVKWVETRESIGALVDEYGETLFGPASE
ncbi:site-specific integrase [Sedimenticola selenatireducens]|uniref:site-specific integrase n=1 Tax=Sedimenticola selenatireducens TaxID=191960 RepID=UPI002AAB4CC2|nr:site-specific integrase [Sedimenticola selenatireducens]